MSALRKFIIAVTAIAGLSLTATPIISQNEAGATPAFNIEQANPAITINPEGGNPYTYEPAQLAAKVGQPITVKSNAPDIHSVTANDRSFSVDIPPQSSATFTVDKPGTYTYDCMYHPDEHNPASLNVS